MRFYTLNDVPIRPDDQVFKESPFGNALVALICYAIAIGSFYWGIKQWSHPGGSPFPFVFGGFFALFGLVPLGLLRASFKPGNWLLRCQPSCLFIKYRAYENWRLPADTLQIAGIEYGEIAWAKLVKERRVSPNTDGKGGFQVQWLTYIDLGMAKPDLSEFEANLAAERKLRPTTGMKVVALDYPVQVQPNGVIEIRWTGGIRPSPKKALQIIGQRVKILDTEHRKIDLTHRAGANPEEEKAKIIALAKSGDHFAAVHLARQVYGYDLTQATNFVDQLVPDGFRDDDDAPKR